MDAEFPEKLGFLFEPHRYKVAWGGRGGAKSWGYARALLILATQKPKRILCGREIQNSIAESVHQLLKDQIKILGLTAKYDVQKTAIYGSNGSQFNFAGLKHNIKSIKSFEAADIVWVEEADQVSKDSWDTLIPTIRKEGSEIWVSFNPSLETDETYKRFVLKPPPGAVVVNVSYLDNPWLPEVLRIEAEHMKETDPTNYQHIWMGACKSAVEGAIYAEEIKAAEQEGRICSVPRDRMRPVNTYWDLGHGDKTAIWFVQALPSGWFNFIDYLDDSGKTIEHYVIQLNQKGYLYGEDWLPHDAVDAIIHKKLAGDKSRSIEMLMRAAGRTVRVAPKLYKADRINAGRTIFPQCRFDATKCADGLQALRHYQWGPVSANGNEPREPLHNWASHGADAFQTGAVTLRHTERRSAPPPPPPPPAGQYSWMG